MLNIIDTISNINDTFLLLLPLLLAFITDDAIAKNVPITIKIIIIQHHPLIFIKYTYNYLLLCKYKIKSHVSCEILTLILRINTNIKPATNPEKCSVLLVLSSI